MKRFFTIIFSALMMLTGAQCVSAQTAIFSLETTGDGNATVGTFEKSGVNNSDDTEQTPKRWTMKSTGAYIQCTCNQAIAEGDVIEITGTPQSTSTSGFCIRLEGDNTAEVLANMKSSGKKKEQTKSYTVEAESKLIGQTTIYVMMEQTRQWWINKIEVLHGTSTGISSASTDKVNKQEAWFDLQGHKVTAPQKGNIYVKNGKKIIF